MQIVIDIPKDIYDFLQRVDTGIQVDRAIANGTPLPKGHGRLIDADYLKEDMIRYGWHHEDCTVSEYVEDMLSTIIEADNVKSEDVAESGYWLISSEDRDNCRCSVCKYKFDTDRLKMIWGTYNLPPHCPNCGAKMLNQT